VRYVDRFLKHERRLRLRDLLGFQPNSYKEVDEHYRQKLEREHGLKFTLWSEDNLAEGRA